MHQQQSARVGARASSRRPTLRSSISTLSCAVLMALGSSGAMAGATLKIGDDASLSVGIGLRMSYSSTEKAAPNGTSRSSDFAVENARLFLNGEWGKIFKATFNTERQGGPAATGGDSIRVMDAIAQFEFDPAFNLWLGRMLPPSDRSNLHGPFYLAAWSYPGVVSNYPNLAVGRDNGAMIWGKPMGGKLVYSLGVFNGHNRAATLSNDSSEMLYAGRLHVNFWDVEPPPAHYLGGTYYGSKDVLSVGIAGNYQKKGVGTAALPGDLKIWSIDGLLEKKLAGGFVPALEAAYYKFNLNGVVDCGSGETGAVACPVGDNIGGQVAGTAWMVGAAVLLPGKVGWGQFQPFVRYQKFDRDVTNTTNKATDVGVNYIINGSNAKVSAMYTRTEDTRLIPADTTSNRFLIGVQLQY